MNNNELINAAKDEAARELYGCEYAQAIAKGELSSDNRGIDYFINRAMEIYAEMVNGWVNVSEKMPELNQFVLADYGYKIPIMFCYKGDGNWLALDAEIWVTDDGIKQWMPLPNKPIKTTKP